jgi:hypothetical protein
MRLDNGVEPVEQISAETLMKLVEQLAFGLDVVIERTLTD